jgi:hypothetical protein
MTIKVYEGHISQNIAQGDFCGSPVESVFFPAPIDLQPGDIVLIDYGSGRPLAVYRDRRKIWEFEGEDVSGAFPLKGTVAQDVLAKVFGGI